MRHNSTAVYTGEATPHLVKISKYWMKRYRYILHDLTKYYN